MTISLCVIQDPITHHSLKSGKKRKIIFDVANIWMKGNTNDETSTVSRLKPETKLVVENDWKKKTAVKVDIDYVASTMNKRSNNE